MTINNMICILLLLVCALSGIQADVVLTDSDSPVAVAAQWQAAVPSLIGADGPLLTQVEAAQNLGLSGNDVTICVIDTGVDISNPNFGQSCVESLRNRDCRVAFGYDVETDSQDPSSKDLEGTGGHGTHVAGIALGTFPDKLVDAKGKPLPFQRGVAYGAKLGAIRATTTGSAFPPDYINRALAKTAREHCDINNLSLGSFHVTPNPDYKQGMELAAQQDILTTAAAGNDEGAVALGPRLFNTASPGAYPTVFAVAHLNNTANPGSLLEISLPLNTSTGVRSTLAAIQRADTRTSICSPTCDGLNLPLEMYLIKLGVDSSSSSSRSRFSSSSSSSVSCSLKLLFDGTDYKKGQVMVMQFDPECKFFHTAPDLWGYLRAMHPSLVLMVMPSDSDAHTGALYYRNAQTPALWLRSDDGVALAEAMAARDLRGLVPLKLMKLPGATVVPLPDMYSGQPALTSAMGPAFDLSIKPDIACPGSLYSSLPNETYQTWPGTSMASPYMAGVLALWKEQMTKLRIEPSSRGGWIQAAFTAMKNTAKPVRYGKTGLVWPPAKVGAGMVQAHSAVLNNVTITPTELLMRTDMLTQAFELTVSNNGDADVAYSLGHQPAVTLSLSKAWYNKAYDTEAPLAAVSGLERVVRVPAKSTKVIEVVISKPLALQALHAIYSGYITLTPLGASARQRPQPLTPISPITLSVAYQGSSKDYSTLGNSHSLALFVPALPELHPQAARLIGDKPSIYVCDYSAGGTRCSYNPKGVRVTPEGLIPGFTFASTLLRPLQDVKIQVWTADGSEQLGTSPSLGPAPSSSPFRRTFLFEGSWNGSYIPKGQAAGLAGLALMQIGKQYNLKLELWPMLAAGDRLVGRKPGAPLLFNVDEPVSLGSGAAAGGDGAAAAAADARSQAILRGTRRR